MENFRPLIVLACKCLHNQALSIFKISLIFKACSYNIRGSSTILEKPRCNLELRHKSFSFIAARIWNSVPPFVRDANDLLTFKRLLGNYFNNSFLLLLLLLLLLLIIIIIIVIIIIIIVK